jgi:hypothetical protein
MREVVFRVLVERDGHLEAQAQNLPIRISAPTHEHLQHEAREALIAHVGAAHVTYRIRILRPRSAVSVPSPLLKAVAAAEPPRAMPCH